MTYYIDMKSNNKVSRKKNFQNYLKIFYSLKNCEWKKQLSQWFKNDVTYTNDFCEDIENGSQKKPQPAFTCSRLTIETLEQGVKSVQS